MANYYNKYSKTFSDSLKAVSPETFGTLRVSISNGNSKMGAVASVSLLPFVTCPAACLDTCAGDCYAAKIAGLRPAVRNAYARNTALALYRPEVYWADVRRAMAAVRFFRFHVSGDIISREYFAGMIDACRENPKTEVLCFTKRYDIVNTWIDEHGALPENLHILFSGWTNLQPVNPHHLPETNVIPKGGEPMEGWKLCGGNCFECACRGVGCWQAQAGETIAFPIH